MIGVCILNIAPISCKKELSSRYNEQVKPITKKIELENISEFYFNPTISTTNFKEKFPFFQGSLDDSTFVSNRTDSLQLAIYNKTRTVTARPDIKKYIDEIIPRYVHFFEAKEIPKIYLYSSGLDLFGKAIILKKNQSGTQIFIDASQFLGGTAQEYRSVPQFQKRKLDLAYFPIKFARALVQGEMEEKPNAKFIHNVIQEGKIIIGMKFLLPQKDFTQLLGYTPEQSQWMKENEAGTYTYFVEQNYIYSNDTRLGERFLADAPFSKFFSANDTETPPQVGSYIGAKICEEYLKINPDISLKTLFNTDPEIIFQQAKYNPNDPK